MLTPFIIISFASFLSWQLLRSVVWFPIPARIAPFIVLLSSLLWALPFSHSILLGFAATGGVAVINYLTKAEGIEPWTWKWFDDKLEGLNKKTQGKTVSRKVYFPQP